jgi:FtsX-like permease family
MRPVAAWFRLDFRRRWRSLLVLALLVAFAAGTVMTAVAGARRGASAVDRLLAQTLPATVAVLPNEPGFDWNAVRALPEVETLSTYAGADYEIDGQPAAGVLADADAMHTVERPVVLDGRLPDVTRADEVVVTPAFVENHGKDVGDSVSIRLFEPETIDAAAAGVGESRADGPEIEAAIVGVVRAYWFDDDEGVIPSAGLFAEYGPNLVGTDGVGEFNAMARLRGGEAEIPAFKAGLEGASGRSDIDVWNLAEFARHDRDVTGFEANALFVFAVVAGLAAILLVGQSVARYTAATVGDLKVLRAVGMTSVQSGWAAAAGPTLAAMIGSALGVAGVVVASWWFPIGTASLFEPAPGMAVDLPVLLAAAVVPALVAVGSAVAAWFASSAMRAAGPQRRSALAAAAARVGAPVPVVIGTRFALEPGRGRQAVPARPAVLGAVVGVLGVVAAFTFSEGVGDATTRPGRFGQVHQLEAFVGYSGEDFGPVEEVLPVMAADPDVVAVNDVRTAIAEVGNIPVALFTLDPVDVPWEPVVLEGRAPLDEADVAVAPGSAEAMGVTVGDVVAMTGTLGTRELTVTGLAFVPEAPHNDYVTGGWVTAEGYDILFDPDSEVSPPFKFHSVLVTLRPGADPDVVAARIEQAAGVAGMLELPGSPSRLEEVKQIRALPVFLAGFLALLALGAVGHALATAARRRRRDIAVLRALGMTQTQSRGVVVTQASVLALVGLVVGIPLGLALGRTVWRYVADTTPLFYVPPVAVLALVLLVPVALLAANLLAVLPSHRTASMRVGHVLRAE